jgi:hypothetical protein
MPRKGNREATYVPWPIRMVLMFDMSKADLAELVWDFALSHDGEEDSEQMKRCLDEIKRRFETLKSLR